MSSPSNHCLFSNWKQALHCLYLSANLQKHPIFGALNITTAEIYALKPIWFPFFSFCTRCSTPTSTPVPVLYSCTVVQCVQCGVHDDDGCDPGPPVDSPVPRPQCWHHCSRFRGWRRSVSWCQVAELLTSLYTEFNNQYLISKTKHIWEKYSIQVKDHQLDQFTHKITEKWKKTQLLRPCQTNQDLWGKLQSRRGWRQSWRRWGRRGRRSMWRSHDWTSIRGRWPMPRREREWREWMMCLTDWRRLFRWRNLMQRMMIRKIKRWVYQINANLQSNSFILEAYFTNQFELWSKILFLTTFFLVLGFNPALSHSLHSSTEEVDIRLWCWTSGLQSLHLKTPCTWQSVQSDSPCIQHCSKITSQQGPEQDQQGEEQQESYSGSKVDQLQSTISPRQVL